MKKILLFLSILAIGLSACSDDETTGPTNRISYDGERYPIFSAFYNTSTQNNPDGTVYLSFYPEWLDTPPASTPEGYFACELSELLVGQRIDLMDEQPFPVNLSLQLDNAQVFRIESSEAGLRHEYGEPGVEMTACVLQVARSKELFVLYLSAEFSNGKSCLVSYRGRPANTSGA